MENLKATYNGCIKINRSECNLDLTLCGGQSFRWRKIATPLPKWCGVAYGIYWELLQEVTCINYTATPAEQKVSSYSESHFQNLLHRYLRTDFDLPKHIKLWQKAHTHFAEIAPKMNTVRILNQEPFENIISFICSQNNHIKRIFTMIQWFCKRYGQHIGHFNGIDQYTFPELSSLRIIQPELESDLREAKFGYRAKFIADSLAAIDEYGGNEWFEKLRLLPYEQARQMLVTLPGIGFKVADCICLMSLGHLSAVPIDTHIFKIAKLKYMPSLANVKVVTPKTYDEILKHFQHVYGEYAGWAQAVLFCTSLQKFQDMPEVPMGIPQKKKKTS